MIVFRAALLCAVALPFCVVPAVADPAGAPVLAAHRAVYDLSLVKAEGNKAPTDARGRIAFDFTGSACEGYAQNFRQLTELQGHEGPVRVSDMRSATFEDGDGRNFRFKIDSSVDQGQVEQTDGKAARSDGGLSVNLSRPTTAKVDLARDVLFPTDHLRHVIEAARKGEHILAVKVFDGSETGQKVYDTTTVIGKPITGASDDASKNVPTLASVTRWPVSVSYFEEGKVDSQPNYVLSFDLYDNGISRDLKLDYGDFTLLGKMVELDLLPSKPCSK